MLGGLRGERGGEGKNASLGQQKAKHVLLWVVALLGDVSDSFQEQLLDRTGQK